MAAEHARCFGLLNIRVIADLVSAAERSEARGGCFRSSRNELHRAGLRPQKQVSFLMGPQEHSIAGLIQRT